MAISVWNRKIIWGRSGNRCSFPGCNCELDITVDGKHTLVGEECHIEAQSAGGPRYNPDLKDVDGHDNLILLCAVHHKIIDSNPDEFTVEKLKTMKAEHEKSVASSYDKAKFDSTLYYASIIDYINMTLEFENWESWTSFLLSADYPTIRTSLANDIEEVRKYLYGRIWPGTIPEYECILKNYLDLLSDFSVVFHEYAEERGEFLRVEKFYHIKPYNWKEANQLLEEYKRCLSLIHNLVLELTRMSNYLCDLTRAYLDPMYRVAEGKLLVTTGPFRDGDFKTACPEYRIDEKNSKPYPGLEKFKVIMRDRDLSL